MLISFTVSYVISNFVNTLYVEYDFLILALKYNNN